MSDPQLQRDIINLLKSEGYRINDAVRELVEDCLDQIDEEQEAMDDEEMVVEDED